MQVIDRRDVGLLRRTIGGAAVLAAGIAVLLLGLFSAVGNRLTLVGAGAAVSFIGLAMLGPLITKPIARLIGFVVLWRGPVGRLARDNATRSPRRTSATAAALMVASRSWC